MRWYALAPVLKSLGGFTGLQLVGFVAPFLALPVIARLAGPTEWVHLAAAQAGGSLAGIVILFGWWTAGPGEYHRLGSVAERARLYAASIHQRALVAIIVLPVLVVVVSCISPSDSRLLCVLASLGMASYGLTPDWYFIAANRPGSLAMYETFPRSLSALISIPAMLTTGQVLWFPVMQIGIMTIAYTSMWLREVRPNGRVKFNMRSSLRDLRDHAPVAASNILGGLYNQLMLPLATLFVPATLLAAYVSADKLYKASRFSIVAVGNTLQSWTLSRPTLRRHLSAICAHAALGLIGGAALAGLTPVFSKLLFGSQLQASFAMSIALGVAFLCTSVTTPLVRNILIPHRKRKIPLVATLLATIVGLGCLYPLYRFFGAEGVAFAVAASEITGVCVNIAGTWQILRLISQGDEGS